MSARSTVLILAMLLALSRAAWAVDPSRDPIPQVALDAFGGQCRGYHDLRQWFDLYCACMAREAPRRFTASQFYDLVHGARPVTDQLFERAQTTPGEIEEMISICRHEAEPARTIGTVAEPIELPADEINPRGHALRAKLDELHKSGHQGQTRTTAGGGPRWDVTDAALPFIPIGLQFDQAEALLRAAGFEILPRPVMIQSLFMNQPREWYAVLARIEFFDSRWFFRTDVYAMLVPAIPGDYTAVSRMSVAFYTTGP